MLKYLKKRALIRRTMNELNSLSDRALSDLGISRCDIYRIAKDSVRE